MNVLINLPYLIQYAERSAMFSILPPGISLRTNGIITSSTKDLTTSPAFRPMMIPTAAQIIFCSLINVINQPNASFIIVEKKNKNVVII